MTSLEKAYVISERSHEDINVLLKSLGVIRSLLKVQAGTDEEEHMKDSLKSVDACLLSHFIATIFTHHF